MRFNKILGKIEDQEAKDIVKECEEKISIAFSELSLNYDVKSVSAIGGDPFIFQLVYPMQHVCDLTSFYLNRIKAKEKAVKEREEAGETIPEDEQVSDEARKFRKQMRGRVLTTAATNGTTIYYEPTFINKKSRIGVRIVLQHEALHGALMHPSRRGSRIPSLFNAAVDYKVNYLILQDLASRKIHNYEQLFKDNLGDYITIEEYARFLRNPFDPPAKMAHFNPSINLKKSLDPGYQDPSDNAAPLYFADTELVDDMKRPEYIYDYLLSQIPKCDVCGRLGKYKKPDDYKELERLLKEQDDKEKAECNKKDCDHDHTPAHECGKECEEECVIPKTCDCDKDGDEGYFDPFGGGGQLVDEHIDAEISEDEMAKKLHEAAENARRCGGKVPGEIEEEIGALISPKLSFGDFVRSRLFKMRTGYGRSDWTRPKIKPMFAGLYSPRKRDFFVKFACLIDTSLSMDVENDITFGLSQLQSLSERAGGYVACFDTQFYPDSVVKLMSARPEELRKTKCTGRGGSCITDALTNYEKYTGHVDMLICITDGGLVEGDEQINELLPKKTEVVWLLTRNNPDFKPNGRIFTLSD